MTKAILLEETDTIEVAFQRLADVLPFHIDSSSHALCKANGGPPLVINMSLKEQGLKSNEMVCLKENLRGSSGDLTKDQYIIKVIVENNGVRDQQSSSVRH